LDCEGVEEFSVRRQATNVDLGLCVPH